MVSENRLTQDEELELSSTFITGLCSSNRLSAPRVDSAKDKSSADLIKIVTDFGVAAAPLLDFGWSLDAKAT